MPTGWVTVKVSGTGAKPVHFCGPDHAQAALYYLATRSRAHDAEPDATVPEVLVVLNRLAGTQLTVMNATGERVRRAVERAVAGVLRELDIWQARQVARRPGVVELLGEAESGVPVPEDTDEALAAEAAGP